MLYLAAKALLSGIIIAIASEIAKRSPALGALILSLPLVSILAFIWLWRETSDAEGIAALVAIDLLVRLADAADVPAAARSHQERRGLLARSRSLLPADRASLRRDGVDARQVRRLALDPTSSCPVG